MNSVVYGFVGFSCCVKFSANAPLKLTSKRIPDQESQNREDKLNCRLMQVPSVRRLSAFSNAVLVILHQCCCLERPARRHRFRDGYIYTVFKA